jgi:hypothetical protein
MEVSGQLHAPAALPPGKAPGARWVGGWVGPRCRQDTVEKVKISCPSRKSSPGRPACTRRYNELFRLQPNTASYEMTTRLYFLAANWSKSSIDHSISFRARERIPRTLPKRSHRMVLRRRCDISSNLRFLFHI